jgi:hypothetical protein
MQAESNTKYNLYIFIAEAPLSSTPVKDNASREQYKI